MTVDEAAHQLLTLIRDRGSVSFAEMAGALGDEGKGDQWIGIADDNIWWWFGMSSLFCDALESLKSLIEPTPTSVLVYAFDGLLPTMPIAKRVRKYKDPHWIPIVWNLRSLRTHRRKKPMRLPH